MTRTARQIAAAGLAALAAVAAIIAADFTPPASAQSDDATTGRIVARQLANGRVEFGWQPTGGARVLPQSRYFPADPGHNRWLRSSPVEVGGAEIGRINARRLSDGRIEFAFTPTDGERILPQSRYFPAGATVGRWLRSTETTIGPPATTAQMTIDEYARWCNDFDFARVAPASWAEAKSVLAEMIAEFERVAERLPPERGLAEYHDVMTDALREMESAAQMDDIAGTIANFFAGDLINLFNIPTLFELAVRYAIAAENLRPSTRARLGDGCI